MQKEFFSHIPESSNPRVHQIEPLCDGVDQHFEILSPVGGLRGDFSALMRIPRSYRDNKGTAGIPAGEELTPL